MDVWIMSTAAERKRAKDKIRAENRERNRKKNAERQRQITLEKKVATPEVQMKRQISRAQGILAETHLILKEIDKNYTSGAAKLAESYGALIEDHLYIALGEEVKELEANDAPIKVMATAYTRQTKAREFLLTLGPKIFAMMEFEKEGSDNVDPMVAAAQRIAQAQNGDVELVRESVILRANPEEEDDYDTATRGSYALEPSGGAPR